MSKITWPVVVLSSNDRFLHVCRDAAGLREHIAADLAGGLAPPAGRRAPTLEFYDVGGQRLQPTVGPLWTVGGFAPTGEWTAEDGLVGRMERALRAAERIDRQLTVATLVAEGMAPAGARRTATRERRRAPRAAGSSLAEQAEHILTLLSEEPPDEARVFNRGGWLHSAWHAAFG